jgi:SRSO17 transposase
MERRFEIRKQELLQDCEVSPKVFEDLLGRLRPFAQPFLALLQRSEQREHAQTYLGGLLSNLKRKNAESIAYYFDQGRKNVQNFLGNSDWDHQPLLRELASQVGQRLGEHDAVLVFDPSGFAKKGTKSVGTARQWLGRLGKVDNGQVGIYLGYVSRKEHALVDVRLYLPKEWCQDRQRCRNAGVPKEQMRHRTRHALALEMLQDKGALLPHAWIAGDDEMGRSSGFRKSLRERGERYLLAVPSNTTIRDLQGPLPPYAGSGRRPQQPFQQVQVWAAGLVASAWTEVEVRPGAKGPLVVEAVTTRVQARADKRRVGPEEQLVVLRARQEDDSWKYDYYLSNGPAQTSLTEFARVAKAEHHIEECFQRGKSEAGLAHYEVRGWAGWHHHQTLSLLATWFVVGEALRGKPLTPAITVPQIRAGLALLIDEARGCYDPARVARTVHRRLCRNELARFYHWKRRNLLAPKRLRNCG